MAAHYLVQGSPDYLGGIHGVWSEQFSSQMQTAESIRTDTAQAKIDFSAMTQQELGGFLRGLHGMAVSAGRDLANNPGFAEAERVVDVGGGSGGLAIGLCRELPHIRVTLFDLPSVVPIAREMIGEAGLADRIKVETADILDKPLPGGFDIATARALFQVLSPDQCRKAARNIAAALPSGGAFFIVGFITDDTRLSPKISVGLNMSFLNMFDDGQAYTESQYRDWLVEAGFTDVIRRPFLAGNSLISARRQGTG
jgi:ubiquinone/menaquinone biosynthesis C-methylase UbiE